MPLLKSGLPSILAAVVLWGAMPFVINTALQGLSPAVLVTSRLLIAGAIMTLLAGPRVLLAAIRSHLVFFLVLALLGFTLPNLLYATAMQSVPIPVLSFIANSYPAVALALAFVFLDERPTPLHLAGIACALVGLYLMAGVERGRVLTPGILLVFLASLGWATSSIAGKKLTADLAPSVIVAGRHVLAGLLALPVMGAAAFFNGIDLTQATTVTWVALLGLIGMSLISMQLYYDGLRRTTVATASLLEAFTPVVTLGLSVLWLGQGLSGKQFAAAGLVLMGSVLVTVRLQGFHASPAGPPVQKHPK